VTASTKVKTIAKLSPLQKLEKAVRKLAKANPDFVYTTEDEESRCFYRPDEKNPKGCIIGAALAAIGLPTGFNHEGLPAESVINDLLAPDVFSYEQTRWFSDVQVVQDEQKPWAEAVADADKRSGR
jgi:hypothetical protein